MMRVLFVLLWVATFARAQKIENLKAVAQGEQILITYDLLAEEPADTYQVSLYSSHNNFSFPVQLTSGDIGAKITGGKNKTIHWQSKTELGLFKGSLSFELRAELDIPLTLKTKFKSIRRGTLTEVRWRGGKSQDPVSIVLLKNETPVATTTALNNGSHRLQVMKTLRPGGDYQLSLTSGTQTLTTDRFAVRRKIPIAAKLIPFAAAGIVYLLMAPDNGNKNEKLVGPPNMGLD